MESIQGGSPSGALWLVVGRVGIWLIPLLDPGRWTVPEPCRALPYEEPGRSAESGKEPLRPPDLGVVFVGIRAFGGEPSAEESLVPLLPDIGGVWGESSSIITRLPILLLLALRAYCMSSQFPLPALLPARLRGSGESLPITFEGTGTGLVFEIGIREVLGRVRYGFEVLCSAAISSGVRNSVSIAGSKSPPVLARGGLGRGLST